jgi:hypothetical protein
MPAIAITAKAGEPKSKRVGQTIVVEKQIKGVIIETHKADAGKRVTGKKSTDDIITLTREDAKALARETDEKIRQALAEGKEDNQRQLDGVNALANRHADSLISAHNAAMKKMTAKLAVVTGRLAAARSRREEPKRTRPESQRLLEQRARSSGQEEPAPRPRPAPRRRPVTRSMRSQVMADQSLLG